MEALNGNWIEWGVAARTLEGQVRSGDRFVARPFQNGFLAGVVDGLGHGTAAALAAGKGVEILSEHAEESVITLVHRCHEGLRWTRGAAMSLASFNRTDSSMTWLGVGNVEGVVLRSSSMHPPRLESLILRSGAVGVRLPQLHGSFVHVRSGDTLILVTDGIRTGFDTSLVHLGSPKEMAGRILASHTKGTDDALVFVARFLGSGK
jgi:serine phosphatase RsbU (regulator of sigma subunit)